MPALEEQYSPPWQRPRATVGGEHDCGTCHVNKVTGVLDRWAWDATAQRLVSKGWARALLLVDVDSFKRINDEVGHPAGDSVLGAVAEVVRTGIQEYGLLGRYGGRGDYEFLILLAEAVDIDDMVATITTGVADIDLPALPFEVSVSIGAAVVDPSEDIDLDALIQRADEALRITKRRRSEAATWTSVSREVFLTRMLSASHLLDGDWIPDVLLALSQKPLRYTDLLDTICSSPVIDTRTQRGRRIQPRILVATLRRMEDDGLVLRHEESDRVPRTVRYELTPAAHELLCALTATVTWCERHQTLIAQADQRAVRRHRTVR